MFDQPELEHLLRTNLKDQSTVGLRGNVEVTDVAQDGQGRVQVDFTDRLTGRPESLLRRLRAGLRRSQQHRPHGHRRDHAGPDVRAALARDRHRHHRRPRPVGWRPPGLRPAPGRHIHARRPTRYRWEFRLLPGETAADYDDHRRSAPADRPVDQAHPGDACELVRVAEYTFRAQLADRWRDRSVFLLGDAAHLTPPFVGQGMGAGLRDAMNLTWKIAGVLAGDLPESVLDTYQVERKPHARAMIRLAKLVGVVDDRRVAGRVTCSGS